MKRLLCLLPFAAACQSGFGAGQPAPATARPEVRVAGRLATIATDRWLAEIENGIVVGFRSRLNGEVLARREADPDLDLPMGLGHQHGVLPAAKNLHSPWGHTPIRSGGEPGVAYPSQHRPTAKSRFTWQSLGDGLRLTYAGLSGGGKEFPEETYTLTARVDAAGGDLLLQASGSSPMAGVYGVNTALANIGKDQRLYFAHFGGAVIDASWPEGQMSFQETGPFLEAPVLIGEGARGAWAFWAEDAKCHPKFLFIRHTAKAFHAAWETLNLMPYETKQNAESVVWHLNVFEGSWAAAAKPYRDWFQQTYSKTLARRASDWAKRIRIVLDGKLDVDAADLRALAKHFDPGTVLLHDWNVRAPAFDTDLPDFTPRPGIVDGIARAHSLGFRTMGYVNTYCVNRDSPVYQANRIGDFLLLRRRPFEPQPLLADIKPGALIYGDPLSRSWRAFHADQMTELVRLTGLDALYEDTAGAIYDFGNGTVDGLQAGQGGAAAMAAVQSALPGVAFATEYGSEPIASVSLWPLRYNFIWGNPAFRERLSLSQRPVQTCLFGEEQRSWVPTIRAEGTQPFHWSLDYADALGGLAQVRPGQQRWNAVRGDNALMIARAHLFSTRQLRPVFPETHWPPNVRCYYEDSAGRRYQVVEDEGQAMIGPDGTPLYRRTRGAAAVMDGTIIPGWPAYDARGVIGLNPQRRYSLLPGKADATAIRITALPEGVFVKSYRQYPGFAVLALAPVNESQATAGEVTFQVTRPSGELIIGGVPEPAPMTNLVRHMTFPAGIVVTGADAAAVAIDPAGRFDQWTEHGVLVEEALGLDTLMPHEIRNRFTAKLPGGADEPVCQLNPPGESLHVLDYLVRVPAKTSALRVAAQQAQTKYGNGTAARIEINGAEVVNFKLPRDASFHEWTIPLGQLAGQPTVISLICDPLSEANADLHRWTRPRIIDDPAQKLQQKGL